MSDIWHSLPLPRRVSNAASREFITAAEQLAAIAASPDKSTGGTAGGGHALGSSPIFAEPMCGDTIVNAALGVLADLVAQGWRMQIEADGVSVQFPTTEADPIVEKDRIRYQELLKRNEQLASPTVRRFIKGMEQPREYRGEFVSIFSLMRDGRELADTLNEKGATSEAIKPYVQIFSRNERCEHTGLRLGDVWRYFRHTWTNQYTTTPGRTMRLLVRDSAVHHHPVMGIAALGSAIMQISERDKWIGWHPQELIQRLDEDPDTKWAQWLYSQLNEDRSRIYLDDLTMNGLYWKSLWDEPTEDAIDKLRRKARTLRERHNRFARKSDFKHLTAYNDTAAWINRAKSDLFRSKRCLALADLLEARRTLIPYLSPTPTRAGLKSALEDRTARRTIRVMLRHAKADAVGTEIADLTVCGALPPYNSLIGGKLIGMLAVSPTVVRAYHDRYSQYASQIASSLAGRPIRRRSNLVYVGTTSLYGTNSSQYNRLRLPGEVLNATGDITFHKLGRSKSFGTSHFSNTTVKALVKLTEESRTGARVNSIFGEGVNPKLRKIRDALNILGWPANELLRHHRSRLIYGVTLVDNLLDYLLGIDEEPQYRFPDNTADEHVNLPALESVNGEGHIATSNNDHSASINNDHAAATGDIDRITDWWCERWLSKRIRSEQVLTAVRSHSTELPVRHGARVPLSETDGEHIKQQHLW